MIYRSGNWEVNTSLPVLPAALWHSLTEAVGADEAYRMLEEGWKADGIRTFLKSRKAGLNVVAE